MPEVELDWERLLAWRLRRHQLVERAPRHSLLAVVDRIGGLHAQVMSCAELTAWARVDGLGPDAVGDALWKRRSLVKLWAMRGTLHLLPARAARRLAGRARHLRALPQAGLAAGLRDHGEGTAGADRRHRLGSRRAPAHPRGAGRADRADHPLAGCEGEGPGELGRVSQAGLLPGQALLRPQRGPQRALHLAGQLGCAAPLEIAAGEEARREVTRRYLGAFGPATRADLARWWGVQPAPAGRMLEALGDELAAVSVEGRAGWMLRRAHPCGGRRHARAGGTAAPGVRHVDDRCRTRRRPAARPRPP